MEKDQSHMTEKILHLTLDIISLLTGERCAVVKMTSIEGLLQGLYPPLAGEQHPITAPPPTTPERNIQQKVLEVISQVMELLTGGESGESNYFTNTVKEKIKEEDGGRLDLGSLDVHKDLHKTARMDHQPMEGSNKRTTPERRLHPPHHSGDATQEGHPAGGSHKRPAIETSPVYYEDSTQESQAVHHHDQSVNGAYIKIEDEEEEEDEMYMQGNPWCTMKIGMMVDQSMQNNSVTDCQFEDSPGEIQAFPDGHPGILPGGMNKSLDSLDHNFVESSGEIITFSGVPCLEGSPDSTNRPDPWNCESGDREDMRFWCPECDRYFKTKPAFQRHNKIHSGEKPFSCSECGKCFGENADLVKHQRLHTGEAPFSCSECGKSFVDNSELNTHRKSHTGKDFYSCSECGKLFTDESKLLTHQRNHLVEESYSCSECGESFVDSLQLMHHQRAHTGVMSYVCSECGLSFPLKSQLQIHQKSHSGEKPYCCSECGKTFDWMSNFIKHQQEGHKVVPDFSLEALSNRSQPGIDQQPQIEEKRLCCSTCERTFADKSQLIAHRRTHMSQKPHSCAECGECFVYKAELDVHLRSHTGQKVYSCVKCGNSYIFKSQLRKHWRIHTGEKRHPCSECGRSFIWKSELELHMRRHRGEKPFPCSECGKCFVLKSKLKQHQKTHSRLKPFHCAECGQGFQYESQLTKHQDIHHWGNPSSSVECV